MPISALIEEVRFAADSPLEEGVWSEPVSEKSSNSGRFWSVIKLVLS